MLHFKSELLAFSARNAFPQLFAWIFLTHPFAASVKTFPLIAVPSSNRSSLIVFVVCFHNFPFYMNLYTILHLIFEILDSLKYVNTIFNFSKIFLLIGLKITNQVIVQFIV